MRKSLQHTLVALLLFAGGILHAQEASILPYIEPMHSDRPGNTFDYKHLNRGQIIQFGLSYQNLEFGRQGGYSTQVRFGTCIGEFDLELSSLNSREERLIDNSVLYADIQRSSAEHYAGLWYRLGFDIDEKLGIGFIAGTSIGSAVEKQTQIYRGYIPDTSRLDTFNLRNDRLTFGLRLNGTISYSFDDHWGLASSIGLVTYDLENTSFPRVTATLNGSYTFTRLTFFAELFTFDLLNSGARYNVGGSYLFSNTLVIDAYFTSSANYLEFNDGIANVGLTYFFR